MVTKTIKINGYSVGDSSVGIGMAEFSIDTGMEELSESDKEFIIKTIIRDIWELHDNGDLSFGFSDEEKEDGGDYNRRMTWEMSEQILKQRLREAVADSLD